jgi:hypothetical protein
VVVAYDKYIKFAWKTDENSKDPQSRQLYLNRNLNRSPHWVQSYGAVSAPDCLAYTSVSAAIQFPRSSYKGYNWICIHTIGPSEGVVSRDCLPLYSYITQNVLGRPNRLLSFDTTRIAQKKTTHQCFLSTSGQQITLHYEFLLLHMVFLYIFLRKI